MNYSPDVYYVIANNTAYRSCYTARVDVAVLEHILQGKAACYEKICQEFAKLEVNDEALKMLHRWDESTKKAAGKASTVEGKRCRAAKKARKTDLLRRAPGRSGTYTYFTCEEQAAKLNEETSGSETETDTELHSRYHRNTQ